MRSEWVRSFRAPASHVPTNTMPRAKAANVLRPNLDSEVRQVRPEFPRAVGLARMPQHVEKRIELPPIGVSEKPTTFGHLFLSRQKPEGFPDMPYFHPCSSHPPPLCSGQLTATIFL